MSLKVGSLFIAISIAIATALPATPHGDSTPVSSMDRVWRLLQDCGSNDLKDVSLCLKKRALMWVDGAMHQGDMEIADGVTLVQLPTKNEKSSRALTNNDLDSSLSSDHEERSAQIETLLVERVLNFIQSHTIEVKLPETSVAQLQRSVDEGRKKKKKLILPLMMAVALKAAALIPLIIGGLALLALKALVVSKLALVLAAVLGLQKLLASRHATKTYEVVTHPHISVADEHAHFGRSFSAVDSSNGHDLAYNAHVNQD